MKTKSKTIQIHATPAKVFARMDGFSKAASAAGQHHAAYSFIAPEQLAG